MKTKTFCYTPFTGLGLYGGFRGNRWLRNRIEIFKKFTLVSLLNQTNRDFVHWISWRPEERFNQHVKELGDYLRTIPNYKFIFTFGGLCIWDDKFPDDVAKSRLATALHLSLRDLVDEIGDVDYVYMVLTPSDDCYSTNAVATIQEALAKPEIDAFGFTKGYICNYATKELAEYNPNTNPPFYTIKFKKSVFIEPQLHVQFAPIKSHEYVANHLRYGVLDERGFLVGCHSENISTHINIPFAGNSVSRDILKNFGIYDVPSLKISYSFRKWLFRKLPHRVQRKLRYIFGELFYSRLVEYLRS